MKTLMLISLILFFNGCTREPTIKKVYVKQKLPKQTLLKVIKDVKITSARKIDSTYTKIKTVELKRASKVSQKRKKQNTFYRWQAKKTNEYIKKNKENNTTTQSIL